MHLCIHRRLSSSVPLPLRSLRDVDGRATTLMLTHKQSRTAAPRAPAAPCRWEDAEWVLFHKFNIASNNYIRTPPPNRAGCSAEVEQKGSLLDSYLMRTWQTGFLTFSISSLYNC